MAIRLLLYYIGLRYGKVGGFNGEVEGELALF